MKKEEMKKEGKVKQVPSEIMSTARVYLIQGGGILGVLLGVFLSTVAVYKAVGGTAVMVSPIIDLGLNQVTGLVFSIVGIAVLAGGIALCYAGFKLRRLNVVSIILGSCGLIIPHMIIGMGYEMAAGIVAIGIGFPWLATLFLWLKGG